MLIGIDGNEANIKKRVGSNIYAFNLIKWLPKLANEDQFIIYLKSLPRAELKNQNLNFRVLKPSPLWTRWRLPIDLLLHRPQPDLFFTPGHYASKCSPVPSVISIMDLSFLHYPDMFRNKDLYQLKNWTRESVRQAVHIFTISNFTKNDIIKNYQIPEKKVTVTYPGVDRKIFKEKITAQKIEKVKAKYELGKKYILYLGTIQPRKNLKRLIKAFSRTDSRSYKLVIAGKKGWLYSDILQEAKKSAIEKQVVFTGFVADKEVPVIIKGASALVLVSLYEGFGIPILEALALGTPVVISKNTGLTEVAGDCGIAVKPTSVKSIAGGLSQVIQLNELERKEISVKNIKQAEKFSWKETARKTLEVIHGLAL